MKQMSARIAELERELASLRGEQHAPAEVVPLRPAQGPNPAGG
jgi:serine O-acetyltransferase